MRFEYLSKPVLLVNSHLHWNPNNDLIKYGQMAYIMSQVNAKIDEISKSTDQPVAVLMVGDHNSRPESALVKMILD